MERGLRDELEGPLPGEDDEPADNVDDLQGGEGLHRAVEVGGEEVPEDLGPEEAVDAGGDLVCEGVVSDEFEDW